MSASISSISPQPIEEHRMFTALAARWMERDRLPDWMIRIGIRRLLRERLREQGAGSGLDRQKRKHDFIEQLKTSPIAIETDAANQQHYEVPARFYQLCLGPNLKYSSALYATGRESLGEAEEAMLALTCERAQLADGQDVLELGCGWGSLTLYMAKHFPHSRITALSNSASQREFIMEQARVRGHSNVSVITADINQFAATPKGFDRIVSVEMFEHMRNYRELLARIRGWIRDDGSLFVHIFCHKEFAYPFEIRDASDWMAKYFFTGGIMPSADLLYSFQDNMRIVDHWQVDGTHYSHTAEAWLRNLDNNRAHVLQIFRETYALGLSPREADHEALRWLVYWRVFFMACSELWRWRGGKEWIVAHYRFEPTS